MGKLIHLTILHTEFDLLSSMMNIFASIVHTRRDSHGHQLTRPFLQLKSKFNPRSIVLPARATMRNNLHIRNSSSVSKSPGALSRHQGQTVSRWCGIVVMMS